MSEKILVTGAGGQIGTELVTKLVEKYGVDQVISSDLRISEGSQNTIQLDVTNKENLEAVCLEYGISQIYHLAAILSAKGEENPLWAWQVNMGSLFNVFETARKLNLTRIFYPSSIAVFGLEAPKKLTPQHAVLIPESIYGISKAAGENLANYYFKRYGLDVRSVRYPGLIGYKSLPGGGTTDYAVEIYHKAVLHEPFECYLQSDAALPMMYMEDALNATLQIMEVDSSRLSLRTGYNIAGCSFDPAEITESVRKYYPDFEVTYKPDFRQKIAESWPASIDDSIARNDWGWTPHYGLEEMTAEMINNLRKKYSGKN
ncbi:MAG TPA: NAD-dependent epimerase/dehydratase family protein [Saprospiraceae bacterium]|nr:NAD-dependent epimerase/dehydratase family protein [Saprospiraceae bacterium]HQW55703.1 NAD-dependent epimerase/dehydratase family protein [Saprospiraceae bacterium]